MASLPNPAIGAGGDPSAQSAASGMLPTIMGALAARSQGAAPNQQLASRLSANQKADPTMLLRQADQINKVIGVMFIQTMIDYPNAASQISAAMKQWSRVLKELGQASNVGQAIKGSEQSQQPQPITFSPAMQGDNAAPNGGSGQVAA